MNSRKACNKGCIWVLHGLYGTECSGKWSLSGKRQKAEGKRRLVPTSGCQLFSQWCTTRSQKEIDGRMRQDGRRVFGVVTLLHSKWMIHMEWILYLYSSAQ